jgi:hypothetical protein
MIAQHIVAALERAGYETRPQTDLIPIRPNPSISIDASD